MLTHILRYFLSIFLGAVIGYERELQEKSAGLRTIILVCLGSTIFTTISLLLRNANGTYDLGRMIAYIVTGIGFLGGGVIFHRRDETEGVTTAATLWVVAGIGILIGLGNYVLGILSTCLVWLVLHLKYFLHLIRSNNLLFRLLQRWHQWRS